MKKLLPLILALIGTGAGIGAGIFLAPEHTSEADPEQNATAEEHTEEAAHHDDVENPAEENHSEEEGHDEDGEAEFVRLNNQFIVPVLVDGHVASLVVLSISLEVEAGSTEAVYSAEPKLRDEFLTVLFDHANAGGFSGAFTSADKMRALRNALEEAAHSTLGPTIKGVLIQDLNRQDV